MNRIAGLLKNRWVISFAGLMAIGILVWFVGPLLAFAGHVPLQNPLTRLFVILLCVVLWLLNSLRVQLQVNKANSQLATSITSPELTVDPQSEQSSEELSALRERFDEALSMMKKTARKKGGAGIYDLPWYIIIGPPGSGKTTSLINSGLRFPLGDTFGREAMKGVGGTRNCDWWFTEDAVLLDTAGRYTSQDSHEAVDSAAWAGFLQLLKKHRRRRPINGVLVAISVADLMQKSEAERARQQQAIKLRLLELDQELGTRFPVYVMLTKCDLVAGFVDYFSDMGDAERSQVWGITFTFDSAEVERTPLADFKPEFDALVQRSGERMLWKMQQERDPTRRALLFAFPSQVASLRDLIDEFLVAVFSPSRYQEPPLLRGLYLTSGTQEGTPIDRIMSAVSHRFGVNPEQLGASAGQPKSYFITRLLKDVVFPEAEMVGLNHRLEVQRLWLQRATYMAVIGLTGLAAVAWTTSFTRNEVYVQRAEQAVTALQAIPGATEPSGGVGFEQSLPRLQKMRSVSELYLPFQDGVPLMMGLGLYQGDGISEVAETAYGAELNRLLLPEIRDRLAFHLASGAGDPDYQYEALKTYLMLGDLDHLDPDQIKLWMELDWATLYADDPKKQGRLHEHLDSMLAFGFTPIDLDDELVEDVRRSLNRVPLAELLYGRMVRNYQAEGEHYFRVSDAAGPAGEKVFELSSGEPLDTRRTGLYTVDAFQHFFKAEVKDIARKSSAENWVLDPDAQTLSGPEIKQLQEGLRTLYFADYIRFWDGTLADIKVARFSSVSHAADVLNAMAGPVSPIRNVLLVAASNTRLAKRGGALAAAAERAGSNAASKNRLARLLKSAPDKPVDTLLVQPEKVVDEHFEPLNKLVVAAPSGAVPIDQSLDLISQLYGQMDSLSAGIGANAVSVATGSSGADLVRRIQIDAAKQPEPVKTWLMQVAASSRGVTMRGARSELNDQWQAKVAPACRQALQGRYPVYKNSVNDMTLVDFGRIFGPGGLIDGFFQEHLQPFVRVSGSRWRWKSVGNTSLGLSNQVLVQFQRAARIRDGFFRSGSAMPSVNFTLKPTYLDANVRSVSIDLEGQVFTYRHGPARRQAARWPGTEPGMVRIEFKDDSGARVATTREGTWALFRLLDDSQLSANSREQVTADITLRGRKSTWELRSDSVVNPFLMRELQQFRCPPSL